MASKNKRKQTFKEEYSRSWDFIKMRVIKWGKGSLFVYVFKKYRFLLKNTGLWASKYRFVFPEVGMSVYLY